MIKIFLIFFFIIFVSGNLAQEMLLTTRHYEVSDEILANPERGFSAFRSSAITHSFCTSLRSQNVTIIQRIHTIPQFRSDSISQAYLNTIQNDFDVARENGMKIVPRFSYTNVQEGEDAPLAIINLHLDQLKPLFQKNYDIIAYIEAGFIGAWGEWYYSSNGLNNTTDRRKALFKILSVLPEERAVVIRTPGYKKSIFNTSLPLSPDSAFSGSYRARTGAHNDCFLASLTDYGTYNNVEQDKTYLNKDNRYVPQGGETCNPSVFSGCNNALVDLARMRWSVLNKDYHPTVLNGWETNGCMNEIKRRLGYRLQLHEAQFPDSVKPEGVVAINLKIYNDGFASPYNKRNLEIILRNIISGERYFLISSEDPRLWMAADTTEMYITAGIPAGIPEGDYSMMLHLADPEPALHDMPAYAIRLANTNLWEDSTGYNALQHDLVISSAVNGGTYNGKYFFKPISEHPTGLNWETNTRPNKFILEGNYPNPFNGITTIRFSLDKPARVLLDIFNVSGQKVESLMNRYLVSGDHSIGWDPGRLGSGTYFYRIEVDGQVAGGKAIFLK
jgi:hypothetical protein